MSISYQYILLKYTVISCGNPPNIANGMVSSTGTTFGETATYSCNTGYQRSGSATVTCQDTGSWSTRPSCTGILTNLDVHAYNYHVSIYTAICDNLTLINGDVTYNPSTTLRLEGTMATHTCNTGYKLTSSTAFPTRTCQSNRQWSRTPRMCECTLRIIVLGD